MRETSKRRLLAVERRTRTLELLHRQGLVTVAELSHDFHVSEETIRRDLAELEGTEKTLTRTYGGAYLTKAVSSDIPVGIREAIALEGKEAIASVCDQMVGEGETLLLDSSTTALHLAMRLKRRKGLTVVSNSVRVVEQLAGNDGIKVICAGGTLRHSQLSFVGPVAAEMLGRYCADKAFVSCVGLTADKGLTDTDEREAEIRRLMLSQARERIVIADCTKLGKTFFSVIAPLSGIDSIVTDQAPSPQWAAELARRKIANRHPGH